MNSADDGGLPGMGDLQQTVAGIAEELVGSGAERGLQVAAYVDQQPVVDVAVGVADPATGRSVRPGTLFYNWSIGKGATATLVHRLVDAGALDHDTPVAEIWPGFARHGKQAITVRQVLNHSAGLPGLPPGVTVDDVCSWEAMAAALEDAEPWWEPGTKVGYHAYTFGFLAGEIVRRVTGRELRDCLAELTAEIGFPGEIRFGIGSEETVDLAVLEDAPSPGEFPGMPDDAPLFRAVPPALFPTAAFGNDPRAKAADIPAGAKVTARALARMYAGWLGPVDGSRLVGAERLAEASSESAAGIDQVYGNDSRWGLGFALWLPGDEAASRAFGMAGAGGSWAGADPERGLAIAVTRNVMSTDFTTVERVVRAVLSSVDRSDGA
jgi:CubicO group peptidase (beta-lactamase class C family)